MDSSEFAVRHSPFRASDFEFRHRVWFIGGIFSVGFSCYLFDHVNMAQALARWLSRHGIPADSDFGLHVIFAIAAVIVAIGAALRTWGTAYLRVDTVMDHKLRTERLVAAGPYRYVRNPLYLGIILLAIGLGFMASRIGFFVIVLGNILFVYRLVLREEQELIEKQGEPYRELLAVPRFWPALRPRLPASDARPRWGQAFVGELFMWGFAASVAVSAATSVYERSTES